MCKGPVRKKKVVEDVPSPSGKLSTTNHPEGSSIFTPRQGSNSVSTPLVSSTGSMFILIVPPKPKRQPLRLLSDIRQLTCTRHCKTALGTERDGGGRDG